MKNGLHIDEFGVKRWYRHGKLHCEDGPAEETPHGVKRWYVNGKLHRTDGPAIIGATGTVGWYMSDIFLGNNVEGFWALWERLTPEQQNNLNLHMWIAKYT